MQSATLPSDLSPPIGTPLGASAMRLALRWAEQAIGLSDPNPRVGCVLLDAAGGFLAAGHTQAAGQAHAEVMALRAARAAGLAVRGATAYVTLEPCAHHGRTPPCCEALIEAGIARVVCALQDPNPQVAGQGLQRLRAAGIQVDAADARAQALATALNIGFLQRMHSGRPYVRLKIAASLDGFTALPDGRSQWITGAAARRDGQAWRRRAGAVLSGIGTVLADDPRLDVRELPIARQPLRVLLDSQGRLPPTARWLAPPGDTLQITVPGATARTQAWIAPQGADGRPALDAVLAHLGALGINELHVEAGATLNAAFLAAGLVDELLLYVAPKWLGQGRGMAAGLPPLPLDEAQRWRWLECTPLDGEAPQLGDLRLRLGKPL